LHNDARTEKVRLIALSSDPNSVRRENSLWAEVDEYLMKLSICHAGCGKPHSRLKKVKGNFQII
jgi:hypothetical protein